MRRWIIPSIAAALGFGVGRFTAPKPRRVLIPFEKKKQHLRLIPRGMQ